MVQLKTEDSHSIVLEHSLRTIFDFVVLPTRMIDLSPNSLVMSVPAACPMVRQL